MRIMKDSFMRHTISITFLVLLFSFPVFLTSSLRANDAPINLQSGGAQALSGPLTVCMESEVVKIKLNKESYVVDASFAFRNTGPTVKLNVGFPKNGEGCLIVVSQRRLISSNSKLGLMANR
jgi:hypothetical protein